MTGKLARFFEAVGRFLVVMHMRDIPREADSVTTGSNAAVEIPNAILGQCAGKVIYLRTVTEDCTIRRGRAPLDANDGYLIRTTDVPHEFYVHDGSEEVWVLGAGTGTLVVMWSNDAGALRVANLVH